MMKSAVATLLMAATAASAYTYMEALDSPRPVSYYQNNLSGSASIGYNSRYTYQDIAASSWLNKSGVFNVSGLVNLPLMRMQQHIGATYGAVLDGRLSDRDVFQANWTADTEIFPNLKAGAGYDLNSGGLPGYVAKLCGKAPHSLAQDFKGYLSYDDPGRGLFASAKLYGGFYGLTGWRFELEAGKRWQGFLHSQADLEVSAGTGLSYGFWAGGVHGCDQLNVKAALPFKINSASFDHGFKVVPFIQALWAGDTRGEVNRACGVRVIDAFQLVAGVQAVYSF